MKPLITLALPLAFAFNAGTCADARSQADHTTPGAALVVEHAEIAPTSPDGDIFEAYLTIWNGTQAYASLVGVKSEAFESSEIYRNSFSRDETGSTMLVIPGHSELRMRPDGVRLVLSNLLVPRGEIGNRLLRLEFGDGSSIEVEPRFVPAIAELTDHRHGDGDRPSL